MLVELLRPVGPELARRWLAVLALVDPADREALVAELERRAVDQYAPVKREQPPKTKPKARAIKPSSGEMTLIHPPQQKQGYVEIVEVSYTSAKPKPAAAQTGRAKGA